MEEEAAYLMVAGKKRERQERARVSIFPSRAHPQ
jgi:hypothetical protein